MTPKELDKIVTDAAQQLPETKTGFIFYVRGDETDQVQFVANGNSATIYQGLSSVAHNNPEVMNAFIGITLDVMKKEKPMFQRFKKQIQKMEKI